MNPNSATSCGQRGLKIYNALEMSPGDNLLNSPAGAENLVRRSEDALSAGVRDGLTSAQPALDVVWEDHDLVFPNSTGAPLDGSSVYHALKRLLAKAGLPTTHRVHDLRHSTATYLLAAHVDPRVVMAVMGWSQVSMLTRYQHILPAMLDDAAARLEIALPLAR